MNQSESRKLVSFYRDLIRTGITEDAPKENQMQWVQERFNSEMLNNGRGYSSSLVKDWLQGLCGTVSVPFYNDEIIELVEKFLGRELTENEADIVLEQHFSRCATALTFLWAR